MRWAILIIRSLQEPLYLPSKSELQVSIWRTTNDRRVWYEWHAESFMSVPVDLRNSVGEQSSEVEWLSQLPHSATLSPSPSTSLPSLSPLMVPPSPLIEAIEMDPLRVTGLPDGSGTGGGCEYELVKIGQTGLHNPGGRSSWIGL